MLQHAMFRWESATVLAGTILLTAFFTRPFPWWPIWGWPLLGLLAIVALAYSSLTDPDTNARVVEDLLRERFDVNQLGDHALRTDLESALDYQQRIESYVRTQRDGALRMRLEDTAGQLVDWVGNMYRLAVRLDAYRFDALLARDRSQVPKEIAALTGRREREQDPAVQKELDEVLVSKQKQLETLKALDRRMKQAELQLTRSLSALATVYGQMQLIDAQDVDSARSDRLRADIQEQIARLNDLLGSINEVYDYRELR